MKHTVSDRNIKESIDHLNRCLESNSIGRREGSRWTLIMEQLLLLYRENNRADMFSLNCSRRKHRLHISLCVRADEHDYLNSGEDAMLRKLLSEAGTAPVFRYKNGWNTVSCEMEIPVPGIWSLRFLFPYLKKTKGYCILALISQCFMVAANVLIPVLTARLITAYTDSEFLRIVAVAAVLTAAGIFSYFCEYLSIRFFTSVYNRVLNELETDLSRRVFRLEDACINKYGTGMFIQRMVSDTENVAAGFNNVIGALSFIVEAVGVIIAVGIISMPLCLIFILTASLTSFLEIRRMRKRTQDDRIFRSERDRYTGFISEMLHGVRDIKLQNSTDVFIGRMGQAIRSANRANYRMEKVSAERSFFRKGIKEICDLVLYACMALMLYRGELLPSRAVIVLNYNVSIASFGWFLASFLDYVNKISVSSERIFQILFSPEFKEEQFGVLCPEEFRGDISFRDVVFGYPNDDPKAERSVILQGLNMDIRAGEKIAIVGKSGSGKTTVFNLITGLYRPDSGSVMIDGTDYRNYSADFLRGNISAVSQNPYIFNMSVRENLELAGEKITEEEMDRACRAALIYDDIMAMPKKYDTVLGEGGVHLSGGQRQRLAIARCLLRKTKVILLDEATSALDNETQGGVINEVGKLFSGCTVITVAHRLTTIKNSDRILFLSEGKILAEGRHEELLQNCEEYRSLYRTE